MKTDHLLLFLMKLKFGLLFSTPAAIHNANPRTVKKNFFRILDRSWLTMVNIHAPIIKPKVADLEEVEQFFDENSLEAGASGDENSDLDDDVNTEDSDNE